MTPDILAAPDFTGKTALSLAAELGRTDVVEKLLASPLMAPSILAAGDKRGLTALMYASGNGHSAVVEIILASSLMSDDMLLDLDRTGKTALMYASIYGRVGVVEKLLSSTHMSLDIYTAKDFKGKTALMYAEEYVHAEVVRLLSTSPLMSHDTLKAEDEAGMAILALSAAKSATLPSSDTRYDIAAAGAASHPIQIISSSVYQVVEQISTNTSGHKRARFVYEPEEEQADTSSDSAPSKGGPAVKRAKTDGAYIEAESKASSANDYDASTGSNDPASQGGDLLGSIHHDGEA